MKNVPRNGAGTLILYTTTAALVLVVLVVGLWPLRFHPPNNVSWIVARDGIRFGTHGSVVSSGQLRVPDDEAAGPCSLELWLTPDFSSASSTILTFSTPSNPTQLQLIQSLGDLFVNKERADRQWRREEKHIAIVSLFQKDRSTFISISGDSGGTSVFIDGSLRRRSNEFRLTCELLTGRLILANSPIRYAPWQGNIFALAIYRGSLNAATIGRHYSAFFSGTAINREDLKNALAIYGFSERGGQLIRDQTRAEPDLTIPGWYSILYPPFLTPAWREFVPTRWYVTDLAINIAGFVPPGFFICATLISLRGPKRSVGLATVAGLSLSLTIEVLQAHIPMRNSGTTDLITNTLGAGIGAALYAYGFRHRTAFRNR
jgi:VanZ like protein/concanavalin A-like lectin/glucanase superfamily protein